MTKKSSNKDAVLPVRVRLTDSTAESDMYLLSQVTSDASTNLPALMDDYVPMHHFGHETYPPFLSSGWNLILPSTTPTLHFLAPEETLEDEQPQSHLFYSYISAELNAEGVQFGDYVDPFMHDVVADENGQPQMIAPDAGKCVTHSESLC